ncbi:MAG: MnhB domain-containing protein [Pseudomonadota bacterium]
MRGARVDRPEPPLDRWLLLPFAAVALGLVLVVAVLPEAQQPAGDAVARALPESGLANPVTGVLLLFRVFDTLLEKAALLAALGGTLVLAGRRSFARRAVALPMPAHSRATAAWLAAILLPAIGVVAVYLVAIGADRPGGAFQAGTVAAAGLIVAVLSGVLPQPQPAAPVLRRAAYGSFAGFAVIGVIGAMTGGAFLALPGLALPFGLGGVKVTILLIEVALTAGVAAILFALAMGTPPGRGR